MIGIAAVKNKITLFVKKERDEKCAERNEKKRELRFPSGSYSISKIITPIGI